MEDEEETPENFCFCTGIERGVKTEEWVYIYIYIYLYNIRFTVHLFQDFMEAHYLHLVARHTYYESLI